VPLRAAVDVPDPAGVRQQPVPEGELVLAGLNEHALPDQLAKRPDQVTLGHLRDRGEQVERHPVAEDRGSLNEPLVGRIQMFDLAAQRLRKTPRKWTVAQLFEVVVRHVSQQFLEEERVAAGAVVERNGGPIRRRSSDGGGEEGRRLAEAPPFQLHVVDLVPALQPVEQTGDGIAPDHLGRTVGAEE
jgi:hypothetical protein